VLDQLENDFELYQMVGIEGLEVLEYDQYLEK
jgi:hypothetical protein